jgi:hypothetical protein
LTRADAARCATGARAIALLTNQVGLASANAGLSGL